MSFSESLAGKHAMVTGGGTGIGFGIARELLACGCAVTIVGHIAEQIDKAEERLRAELPGAELRIHRGDVTVEDDLAAAVRAASDADGKLDIAIANAGSASPGPILLLEKSDWDYTSQLNLTGTALTIKRAALAMRERGGSIVTISSVAATKVEKWMAPYSATKAAVEMLTRCAAIELAPFGIRVNCIAPGWVHTEASELSFSAELKQECIDHTPLGAPGMPVEIARGVIYLSSEAGSWVTGHVMQIGGGMHVPLGEDFESMARLRYGDAQIDDCKGPGRT